MSLFTILEEAFRASIPKGGSVLLEGFTRLIPLAAGLKGRPSAVITDLGVLPNPQARELTVSQLYSGVSREQIQEAAYWDMKFSHTVTETELPTGKELNTLRDLINRTEEARARRS